MFKKSIKSFFIFGALALLGVLSINQLSAMDHEERDQRHLAIRTKEEKCTCGLVPEGLHWGCLYNQGHKYFKSRTAYKEAFEFFSKAEKEYHLPKAQFYMGVYYEFGLGGVEKSLDEAAKWYTKALAGDEGCEEALPSLRRVIQKKVEALG